MSTRFPHSPADVVRRLLVDLGEGSSPDATPLGAWPVYEDKEPSEPDEVITVYDTAPRLDGRSMIDGEQFQHWGITVRVRGRTKTSAYRKAESIRVSLNERVKTNVVTIEASKYVVAAVCGVQLVRVGDDSPQTRRHLYNLNMTAAILPYPYA